MATASFARPLEAEKYYVLYPEVPEVTEENAEEIMEHYGLEGEDYVYSEWDYDVEKGEDVLVEKIDVEKVQREIEEREWEMFNLVIEDRQELIRSELKERLSKMNVEVEEEDFWYDDDRNYPRYCFGAIRFSKTFEYEEEEIEVYVNVYLLRNSGYYGGCTFDYVTEFSSDIWSWEDKAYMIDEVDDLKEDMLNTVEYTLRNWYDYEGDELEEKMEEIKGELGIFFDNLLDKRWEIVKKIEEIYRDFTEPYRLCGRASNGEAFYCKAE